MGAYTALHLLTWIYLRGHHTSAHGHHSASPIATLLGAFGTQSVCWCEYATISWKSEFWTCHIQSASKQYSKDLGGWEAASAGCCPLDAAAWDVRSLLHDNTPAEFGSQPHLRFPLDSGWRKLALTLATGTGILPQLPQLPQPWPCQ